MRLLVVSRSIVAPERLQLHRHAIVDYADSTDEAVSVLRHDGYDLVLVDVASMSDQGLACIRRLRSARHETPLIALTGHQADDKVRALGLGADDAVTQPIGGEELQARIIAVLRRHRGFTRSLIEIGNLTLSLSTREVHIAGLPVRLTGREYAVLELLVLKKGLTVSKDMFLSHLYGGMDEAETKIIDVFICKLRRKLERAGADIVIVTSWGQGHTLRETTGSTRPLVDDHAKRWDRLADDVATQAKLSQSCHQPLSKSSIHHPNLT
jgi:two-component system, cell cycle response regulator CtrA